jgi:hypothetical protein
MLEQKLQEELNRYKAINKYGKTMIMEQDAPPADPALDAVAPPSDPALDAVAPPADPTAPIDPAEAPADVPAETDTTEEIDITDLVNMTKSLKKDVEDSKNENGDVIGKMDDVFTKLSDLESKLSQMDQVMAKIDELGAKVEASKPKTGVEKLEMRSLDSYPFNEKPQEFFAHKQGEMQASGKNEYVLTKNEVENYPADTIKTSFNQEQQEDEYKF